MKLARTLSVLFVSQALLCDSEIALAKSVSTSVPAQRIVKKSSSAAEPPASQIKSVEAKLAVRGCKTAKESAEQKLLKQLDRVSQAKKFVEDYSQNSHEAFRAYAAARDHLSEAADLRFANENLKFARTQALVEVLKIWPEKLRWDTASLNLYSAEANLELVEPSNISRLEPELLISTTGLWARVVSDGVSQLSSAQL